MEPCENLDLILDTQIYLFQCLEADVLGAVVCVEDGDVGGGPAARHDGLLLEVLEEQAQRDVAPERLDVHLGG